MEVSNDIRKLVPYKPGKPIAETQREFGLTDVIKLASNENALGPSPKAVAAMKKYLDFLHLYPDGASYSINQKVAKKFNVDPSWVVFGNGSNEIIDILIRIYCEKGDSILTTQAAFLCYRLSAQAARVGTIEIPYNSKYEIDIPRMIDYIKHSWTPKHKLIFLPNPNNPTGTYSNKAALDELLDFVKDREDLIVVFDEAYFEFARAKDYPDALEYVRKYPNVVTMRTMSKVYGLAGLRLGYCFARPEVADYFHRVRNPFNVNALAQVAAEAALDDEDFIKRSRELVWQGLDYFYSELKKLSLPYLESQGNFVLFDTLRDPNKVSHAMLKRGVILRPVQNYGFMSHLRMSVGLQEENRRAINALTEVMKDVPR